MIAHTSIPVGNYKRAKEFYSKRKEYWPGYYAAFVYDADGHNIEAVFYDYDEK